MKLLDQLPSLQVRGPLGAKPSDLARRGWPGWRRWALLARSGWFDLASSGSIWVPWAFWLARFGRPGRSWLALAGQRLPNRHDLQKKIDLIFDDPASMLPASCALDRFFMPQI